MWDEQLVNQYLAKCRKLLPNIKYEDYQKIMEKFPNHHIYLNVAIEMLNYINGSKRPLANGGTEEIAT